MDADLLLPISESFFFLAKFLKADRRSFAAIGQKLFEYISVTKITKQNAFKKVHRSKG